MHKQCSLIISDVCSYDVRANPTQHFQRVHIVMKNELMFHIFVCFSLTEITINMAALGRSDCVNMICEIQILAVRSLPSVLIAFLREKHFSRSRVISVLLTVGIGKLLLESHLGHKPHRRRGSEQQRALTRTCGC